MRVLIISHNSLSPTSNMGKTLLSYFQAFSSEEIAQFYIHSEVPTDAEVCRNYYRFTDVDALKSICSPKHQGKVFCWKDVQPNRILARTDTGLLQKCYRYGEKRTAVGYFLRNLLWKFCRWDTDSFWNWLAEIQPDVVFFAAGDYGFLYEMAGRIAAHIQKPLVISCVDDYYFYNRNETHFLGRVVHKAYRKIVDQTMAQALALFAICPSLQNAYGTQFRKPCWLLPTSATPAEETKDMQENRISYLGNLWLGREQQIIAIGRALQDLEIPDVPKYLDVYSTEQNPAILEHLSREKGIRFHGAVSAEEVLRILRSSMAVVHTESFDPQMQQIVRYSVSTKIPESLMNGPCLIAYGPEGIASMDYLQEHGAAFRIAKPEQLHVGLAAILSDANLRQTIQANARTLARKNHLAQSNSQILRNRLAEICKEQKAYEGTAD